MRGLLEIGFGTIAAALAVANAFFQYERQPFHFGGALKEQDNRDRRRALLEFDQICVPGPNTLKTYGPGGEILECRSDGRLFIDGVPKHPRDSMDHRRY